METLGHFLKSQREQSHLSQEDVATQTRIPLLHIQTIEADQFDRLPHGVAAKGFLRLYARCVGANEATVLRRFSEIQPSPPPVLAAEPTEPGRAPSLPSDYIQVAPATRRTPPLRIALLVAIAIGLIGWGIQTVWFQELEPVRSPAVESAPAAPEPVAEDGADTAAEAPDPPSPPEGDVGGTAEIAPVSAVSTPPQALPPTPTETASVAEKTVVPARAARAALPSHPPLLLDIEAREKTWLRIVIDGRETWDVTLAPKETVSWSAKEEFRLTLGNAGGVSVRLNGKTLAPLGPRGKVVRDVRLVR